MRFYTICCCDKEVVAVEGSKGLYCLEDLGWSYADMNALICQSNREDLAAMAEKVREADEAGTAPCVAVEEANLCAPIPRPRQDIVCLGVNYAEHAAESGHHAKTSDDGKTVYTVYFSKRVNRAGGPGSVVPSHRPLVDSLDYEVELGVIIGKDARGVRAEDADAYIFGYTIVNDFSARNVQNRHSQWYLGKSLDGLAVMGPCIVTADEIENVYDLRLTCSVNGEVRQNSNTSLMMQTVHGAIAELSVGMTLQAGTIIATGTPAGVAMGMKPPAYLNPGDEVVCQIEKIGKLCNRIE